jgi:hypothetical protein
MIKKILMIIYFSYLIFGLYWLQMPLLQILSTSVSTIYFAVLITVLILKIFSTKKMSGILISSALILFLLGLILSLRSRTQGQIYQIEGQKQFVQSSEFILRDIKLKETDGLFLSKKMSADLTIDGQLIKLTQHPKHINGRYLYLAQFGFAPFINVTDRDGRSLQSGSALFGLNEIEQQYLPLIPRNPPPRLMLGVGTFPPDMEALLKFGGGNGDYRIFIRIAEAKINGRRYNLQGTDYYRFLSKGRLEYPLYRVMVFKDKKLLIDKKMYEGKKLSFGGYSLYIPALLYWAEIDMVKDSGLILFPIGIGVFGLGVVLSIIRLFLTVVFPKVKIGVPKIIYKKNIES